MCASTWARVWSIWSRNSLMRRESLPASCSLAACSASSVREWIKSATASAWARSMRPLRKARRVNSPGSARRAPLRQHRVQHRLGRQQPAVAGDFHHVLAREGARRAHDREQHFVHIPPAAHHVAIENRMASAPRRAWAPAAGRKTPVGHRERFRAGNPNHRQPAFAQRRRNRSYGVVQQHRSEVKAKPAGRPRNTPPAEDSPTSVNTPEGGAQAWFARAGGCEWNQGVCCRRVLRAQPPLI